MRRWLTPLLVVVLACFLPSVSAETYRISGMATYGDNTAVVLQNIEVQCYPGDADCYQYRGATALLDGYGTYMLVLEVEEEDDGTEILLTLRGEQFPHTLDLDTFRNTSDGRMTQFIMLEQTPASSGAFGGAGCCLLLFALVFLSTLMRTISGLATPKGRMAFQGYKEPNRHDCPDCGQSIAQHNLVKHLIFGHDYDPMDAGEAAGRVMRRSWSSEEVVEEE